MDEIARMDAGRRGGEAARESREGQGKSVARPSGQMGVFQEILDQSPRVQTQMRLAEVLQRRSSGPSANPTPVVQRLKTASQFGLDPATHGDLIGLINAFHQKRSTVGLGPYDDNDVSEELETMLYGIMRKAEDDGLDSVADDASTELQQLSRHGTLREPAPEPLTVGISQPSDEPQVPVASSSTVDREVDPVMVAQYKTLILHAAEQDHERLMDSQKDIHDVERELGRLEKEDPGQIVTIWSEGLVEQFLIKVVMSDVVSKASAAHEIDPDVVVTALSGLRISPDLDAGEIEAKLAGPLKLFKRVVSILEKGVLPPSALEKKEYKGSSDIQFGGQSVGKASYFDIDVDRNTGGKYDERFATPGHSSVSVALEREHERRVIGEETLELARAGDEEALTAVSKLQSESPWPEEPVSAFMNRLAKLEDGLAELGSRVRAEAGALFRSILKNRAKNTAMVVSAGQQREGSRLVQDRWVKKTGYGPNATEMRVPVGLEPEAISYVILPAYMEIFRAFLERRFPVSLLFVGDTEIDIGYFDAETGPVPAVRIPVPNYQKAIEDLIGGGKKQLITHVTRV